MVSPVDPATMRAVYARTTLVEADCASEPMTQFGLWFDEAVAARLNEPNAMVLATTGPDGPNARTVLLKGFDGQGFRFFTNRASTKAAELAADARAALVFPWHAMHRQVRVKGTAQALPDDVAMAYFAIRPRESQLGAWASRQSVVVAGRGELEDRFVELAQRWPEGADVPMPPFWGGYVVVPESFEFWQGRPGRLHDRLRYRRDNDAWVLERLAP